MSDTVVVPEQAEPQFHASTRERLGLAAFVTTAVVATLAWIVLLAWGVLHLAGVL